MGLGLDFAGVQMLLEREPLEDEDHLVAYLLSPEIVEDFGVILSNRRINLA